MRYVIWDQRVGTQTRWNAKDETLYTAHKATVFKSLTEARRAVSAAVKFWNSERFRRTRRVKADEYVLIPLDEAAAKGE